MKNILIVEDKKQATETLMAIIRKINPDIQVFWANTKEKAYTYAMETDMNLIIVDIVLKPEDSGDISGILFVQNIRNVEQYRFAPIIMITSVEDPKLYSYSELHCYSYIEKPYDIEKVEKIIRQALFYRREEKRDKKYVYKKDGVFYTINIEDIVYIENRNKKVKVYMTDGQTDIPYTSIARILKNINSNEFIQCNRNCIINKKYLERYDNINRLIQLKGVSHQIDIGIVGRKKILAELKND